MDNQIILTGVVILGFIIVIFLTVRKSRQSSSDKMLLEWLKSMQVSVEQTNKTLHQVMSDTNRNISSTLHSNTQALNERLDNATKVIASVQKNIGEMSEIGRGMKELQEFLRSPKLRGNVGEQVLKELLGQMLPKNSFHLQHSFKNGTIVDACIKTEAGMIPIDSKFPMENFRKLSNAETDSERKLIEKEFVSDVKKHIDSISRKYILTDEGTIDYALMYIPSESVYYEIVNNTILYDYSSTKRVLPVSPTTFYAFLKAILMGLEGQKLSNKVHEVLAAIRSIQKEYEKVEENLDTLSRHIQNSHHMVTQVQNGYTKLGQQINHTTNLGIEKDALIEDELKNKTAIVDN